MVATVPLLTAVAVNFIYRAPPFIGLGNSCFNVIPPAHVPLYPLARVTLVNVNVVKTRGNAITRDDR